MKDCSFVISPNERIALVGLNGAGKSTILKLLFGFYYPNAGRIKLNDIDIREYDIYSVTVSYTHLDVYKRQEKPTEFYSIRIIQNGRAASIESLRAAIDFASALDVNVIHISLGSFRWIDGYHLSKAVSNAAVSYTHLDVYKRQTFRRLCRHGKTGL